MPSQLSAREKACLAWTASGKSSWEIGKILCISENTVIFHIKNAMNKLDASSRTQAAVKAMQLNLIEPASDSASKTEGQALCQEDDALCGREYHGSSPLRKSRALSPPRRTDRLRLGVLPFLTTHSSRGQALAISLSEEIAAGLARFPWFDVTVPLSLKRRTSEFALGDDTLKYEQLDYVVDGTLSGDGKQFYIDVRLFELAADARPVWTDRFSVATGATHRLDELVTSRIVGQIDPLILYLEGHRRRANCRGGGGLLLLAVQLMSTTDRKKFKEAGRIIRRALEMEPDNALVVAWAAQWQSTSIGEGWTRNTASAAAAAQEYALMAIRLAPNSAEASGICGHISSFLHKDFDSATYYFDRALRLNPRLAHAWAFSALTHCYVGGT